MPPQMRSSRRWGFTGGLFCETSVGGNGDVQITAAVEGARPPKLSGTILFSSTLLVSAPLWPLRQLLVLCGYCCNRSLVRGWDFDYRCASVSMVPLCCKDIYLGYACLIRGLSPMISKRDVVGPGDARGACADAWKDAVLHTARLWAERLKLQPD
jgi:hypothetical protein